MRFRGTLVVLGVVILLGTWVYLYEVRGGRDREAARQQAERLLGIAPVEVTAVRVTHSGTLFALERRDGRWILTRPMPAPCDPRTMTAFLDTLAGARREEEVGRGDLEKYGLDEPVARVEIDAGGRTRRLAFGNINPLQTLVYVLVDGSDQVLLTTSSLLTFSLNKAVGWRDKRMIDVDPAQVQRMSFRTIADGTLAVRRGPHGWVTEGPVAWRVEPARAQSLLLGLARLEAIDVAAENKANLAGSGVDNRRFGAQVEAAGGGVLGDLVLGFTDGRGTYCAIVPDKPEIFRIDGRLADNIVGLVRTPRDTRALPPFIPDDIDRIQVQTVDDAFVLRRVAAQDWKVASSQKVDSTRALVSGAVDEMLTGLATLEVAQLPDRQPPASLYQPALITVLLYGRDRLVSGLEIGKKDPNGMYAFARGPGEPAVFLLSPAALMQVPFDLERLLAPELPAPEGGDRG